MRLQLPQGQFHYDAGPQEWVLLVAGGRAPAAAWLQWMAARYPVWAVDRGADVCRNAGVRPELLFGDADSGSRAAWDWAESCGIPIERYQADKDRTDLQLALAGAAKRRPAAAALVTGGLGGRFDHAYSNVFSLLETGDCGQWAAGLVDESEVLLLLRAGQNLQAEFSQQPPIVSLLPLSELCSGICSQGLHWPLDQAVLRLAAPGGISNRLAAGSNQVRVSLGSGCLGVYCCWRETGL